MEMGEGTLAGPNDAVMAQHEDEADARQRSEFRAGLTSLINRTCRENGSNTPDYILASYLEQCLDAFDGAVTQRSKWYGQK